MFNTSAKKQAEIQDKQGNPSYSAKDIYVLEGLEPVRRRPGMYIGSTGVDGLHHLIWEVVDNSLDEAINGHAKRIEIILHPNNRVSVTDDGRGIPVDIHAQTKVSALQTVMCTLHAGGKFGGESYKISGGLHGVGVSVVNALSSYMRTEVHRDGYAWIQEYKRGKPVGPVKKGQKSDDKGTIQTFEPDPEVFSEIHFDVKRIMDHLREQAYLVKNTFIVIRDERDEKMPSLPYAFYFEGGIVSYLNYLLDGHEALMKVPFYGTKEIEGMVVEVALTYIDDMQSMEVSFANNIRTGEGGMHLTGFRSGLTRVLNDYAKQNGFFKNNGDAAGLTGDDVREGLVSIVSVKLREPQFEGQTKAKLGNPESRSAVETLMNTVFKEYLEKNPQDAKAMIEKVMLAAKARVAARAAKESVLRKGVLERSSLPGRLADCQSRQAEDSELFIVEGPSAGGSAKEGRDRRTQAILPLRGKPLNVEKVRMDKMLANEEIRSLIIALGTAIAGEFNLDKLRYHKIIIMADADVDGMHIRTLLLTLFFRYFQPIIDGGYLYIAQPPLFRIQKGKTVTYAYSDEEKDIAIKKMVAMKSETKEKKSTEDEEAAIEEEDETEKISGASLQRYKGLGEMNPSQLWETTMDPARRRLKQVAIADAIEADKLFNILMGDEVLPRKKFIQTQATQVKELDV
ncbi:MAG: gyrase subunit B protein [Parcubacteria group bacterium GW2011_GWB1_46_8]|nr:MAG: gyrase subunit B protein [Parcubacteria group bacterium GW2011_GWB1_46_8]KKU47655.1 MAG: gyrase subunit B protein [Parcubacteria group bacterium GW2011_GWF2_46_8]